MGNNTILVIEDNDLNRKLVCSLLTIAQYQTIEAMDSETGIQLASEHRPGLILMDIELPGMDGLKATRLIKNDPDLKDIPVVALTAYAMAGDEQKALDAGCAGYLSKPIDTRSFLNKIAAFINHGGVAIKQSGFSSKKRLMVVDDDPSNVKLLAAKLTIEKYEIISAYNGKEALEKVKRVPPDLILLDIMMPGMDGYEVTKQLKSDPETRNIPIILVTALDGKEDKEKGLKAGADEFLNKPVNTVELRARVRSLLRLKEYNEQLRTRVQCENLFSAPASQGRKSEKPQDSPVILLVEDDDKDAKLFLNYLAELPYRVKWARDGEEAMMCIRQGRVDALLLDILLPQMNGFEVCRRLKNAEETRDIQIVVITSLQDLQSKIKSIELGADEYLVKPINEYELRARIHALIRKKAYLDRLRSNYETAFSTAITDKLTGLYNRLYFEHFLELEIKRSLRQKTNMTVMMIDIDDFKKYNDHLGHLEGDRILKNMGETIKQNIRETDLGGRYGGEEFLVVLPATDENGAVVVAERIRQAIERNTSSRGKEESKQNIRGITVSIGIATCPLHGESVKSLIMSVDNALYQAKREGKNRVCVNAQTHFLDK